jgi:HEAT repeat protein
LSKIGPEAKAAVPALIEALEDNKNRSLAANALGSIGSKAKAAVPTLIEALKDADWSIRVFATWALEQINTPEAQKALEEYEKQSK